MQITLLILPSAKQAMGLRNDRPPAKRSRLERSSRLRRRGQAGFTVPLFAEYLTENHPLETFEENA